MPDREPRPASPPPRSEPVGAVDMLVHEIKSPLTALYATLDRAARILRRLEPMAERWPELPELRQGVGLAQEATERIHQITQEYLSASVHHQEPCAAVDVCAPLAAALRLSADQLAARARVVSALAPVPPVHGVERRLGQVFTNLLLNASQAIAPGQVEANEIHVCTGLSADGAQVVVEISDTGHGITDEVKARLFEPFFTTRRDGHGHGIGLWISQNIVRSMGGSISVVDGGGRRTTFRVTLPTASGAIHRGDTPTLR